MAITASTLRANIYRILDEVAESGVPVEILRAGKRLKIIPAGEAVPSKLSRIKARHEILKTDPQDLVHLDWSNDWKP